MIAVKSITRWDNSFSNYRFHGQTLAEEVFANQTPDRLRVKVFREISSSLEFFETLEFLHRDQSLWKIHRVYVISEVSSTRWYGCSCCSCYASIYQTILVNGVLVLFYSTRLWSFAISVARIFSRYFLVFLWIRLVRTIRGTNVL